MDGRLLILGAGTFAQEATIIAEESNVPIVGFAIDRENEGRDNLLCLPVLHLDKWEPKDSKAIAAIISPEREGIIVKAKEKDFDFGTLIHPSSSIANTVGIMQGVIINRLVAIGTGAYIGPHSIVNRGATIGHHCRLGRFVTVGPGANIAGNVVIDSKATIGMGVNIREGVTIGQGAIVGMGAVVLEDIPPFETWYGVPAKPTTKSKRDRVYNFFYHFYKVNGYSPTTNQIMTSCQLSSENLVQRYLNQLEDEGKIIRRDTRYNKYALS